MIYFLAKWRGIQVGMESSSHLVMDLYQRLKMDERQGKLDPFLYKIMSTAKA